MTVPVHSTVPDSTLAPFQVRQKVRMSGLGCDEFDDFTNCEDWNSTTIDNIGGFYGTFDPPVSAGTDLIDFNALGTATQPDGSPWPFDPGTYGSPSAGNGGVYATGSYIDGGGDLVVTLSNGQSVSVQQNGHVVRSSGSPTPSSGTVTSAQSNAWPSVIGALINAGVRLGTVNMLPPGTSLLPNGTIVGSGQSLVRPGVITSNSLTSGINALLQNPMFLIGGFGILALAIFAGGRR